MNNKFAKEDFYIILFLLKFIIVNYQIILKYFYHQSKFFKIKKNYCNLVPNLSNYNESSINKFKA